MAKVNETSETHLRKRKKSKGSSSDGRHGRQGESTLLFLFVGRGKQASGLENSVGKNIANKKGLRLFL
jgi:hypothetical protein